MIETKEELGKALAPLKWGAPASAKAIEETIEALREVARAAKELTDVWADKGHGGLAEIEAHRKIAKAVPALPDWLTERDNR